MSKVDISEIDLTQPGALDAILEQLVGAAPQERRDPPWVNPKPSAGYNPVGLAAIPDDLLAGAAFIGHPGERHQHTAETLTAQFNKSTAVARFINSEVLNAIVAGGRNGISASDLYWAWGDSGYQEDFGVQLGDVINGLSNVGLVNFNPTLETDQQIVAIGGVHRYT